MKTFRKESDIQVPSHQLERWHYAPGAFLRLAPPWERMKIIHEPNDIADGTRAELGMKAGPFWTNWIAEHRNCIPGRSFSDVQIEGPFAKWTHLHLFESVSDNSCRLIDNIDYRLPFGFLGEMGGGWMVRQKLAKTFRYRHAITKMDLERASTEPGNTGESLTILITGATGMVGRALEGYLRMRGHQVRRVTRSPKQSGDVKWDLEAGTIDLAPDEKIDAVVHLAGENIAVARWSKEQKQRILKSRESGTRLLAETIASLQTPPKVMVSVSGANFYQQGTERLQDESSPRGDGFLADVCEVWESETAAAEKAGIRVVKLRMGVVLSPAGGALAKMLLAFNLGVAGPLGSGEQRMAWIALDDVIDIMHRSIVDDRYLGVLNAVAPENPTNREFTKVLAGVLKRPAFVKAPALALRLLLGREMADETLLADLAIEPGALKELGYEFRLPNLDSALRLMLGAKS